MIDRTTASAKVVAAWVNQPVRPPHQYAKIVIRPAFRVGSPTTANAHDIVPADLSRLRVQKMAEEKSIIALVCSAQWLPACIDTVQNAWSGTIVTTVARFRTTYTPNYPIDEGVEFTIIGAIGSPDLCVPKRANVLKTRGQLYGLMDELLPGRKGLVCFASIDRKGWHSWQQS